MSRAAASDFDIRQAAIDELARAFSVPKEHEEFWRIPPVTSRVFFAEFIDESLYPLQQEFCDAMLGLNPLEWDERYFEGDAYWGKGSGKDRTIAKMMSYTVYLLLCMRDPQGFFELGRNSQIDLVNVSINAKLAKDVFFKNLCTVVRMTINPATNKNWFEEQGLNLTPGKDIQSLEIRFPRSITCHSLNSESYTGEGLSILMAAMDEVGGFPVNGGVALYDSLRSSIRSRFPTQGKLLLMSYKYADNDLMEIKFREALKDPCSFTSRHSTFEVNLRITREDLAPEYVRDPEKAQRIYECKSGIEGGGYIKRIETISGMVTRQDYNPVVGGHTTIASIADLSFQDDFKGVTGRNYVIHVDLAKGKLTERGDAAGFMLAHPEAMFPRYSKDTMDEMLELGFDPSSQLDNEPAKVSMKGIRVDLALQIVAPRGGEVIFSDIRNLIFRLKQIHQFSIVQVTFDGWQSVDSQQQVRMKGIPCDELSVDKTLVPYDTFKSFLYQGLFCCYEHPVFMREVRELKEVNGKVDHPKFSYRRQEAEGINRGSKDVADCAAAIACNISENIPLESGLFFGGLG